MPEKLSITREIRKIDPPFFQASIPSPGCRSEDLSVNLKKA